MCSCRLGWSWKPGLVCRKQVYCLVTSWTSPRPICSLKVGKALCLCSTHFTLYKRKKIISVSKLLMENTNESCPVINETWRGGVMKEWCALLLIQMFIVTNIVVERLRDKFVRVLTYLKAALNSEDFPLEEDWVPALPLTNTGDSFNNRQTNVSFQKASPHQRLHTFSLNLFMRINDPISSWKVCAVLL